MLDVDRMVGAYAISFGMTATRRSFLGAAVALLSAPRSILAAADWLTRWLAAFNSARASSYAEFVRAHVPTAVPYLDDDLGMREASGGFVLLRSEQTAAREITAWVRDRRWDRFSRVVLTIGDGGIDDVSFLGAPPPSDFRVRRLSERQALDQLRSKLRIEAAANRFSGAVLVAKGGDILFRESYGAVSSQTRFCIGSMGKMFTAVAVLQLIQNGKLRLSDTIAAVLPQYPQTQLAREVTVEHLLTHTGGTGDFFGAEYAAHQAEIRTPADFIRRFGSREAAFPPGSRWGYSNFGFIVLGAILEQVADLAWQDYLQTNVFQPAGMTWTSPLASEANTARPCTGAAETGLRSLPFYVGLPAGGGYSTVGDLHLFGVALHDRRLLDATHLDLLTRARVAASTAQWSLGLRVAARNRASYFGHGGSAPGINADFAVFPDSRYQTIVLANRGHPHAVNVADYVGARLPL
jgi:D-alanyl-D-alanine carboxypeptidase